MLYVLSGRTVTPFHGDESTYTAMSVDYAYLFIDGDIDRVLYNADHENPIEQSYRITDAVLVRYLIGATWHAAGYSRDALNIPWWWSKTYDYNVETNRHPSDELLLLGRIPMTLLTAGGVLLVFLIGFKLQGRVTAYLAALYFGLNPAILLNGRRAMKEGPHLFFALFVLLAAMQFITVIERRAAHPGRRTPPLWVWAVTLGVGSGLAIAGKHTNVMVVGVAFFSVAMYLLLRARQQLLGGALNLALATVLCGGTFLALNPVWWSNPIERALVATENRAEVLRGQIDDFDNSYRGTLGNKLGGFWQNVFAGGAPMYYEAPEWADYIGGQIPVYERTPFTGFAPPGTGVPLFALMLLGYAVLLGWLKPVPLDSAAQWVLGFWGVAVLIYALFMVPLGWQRYYLPFLPVLGITAALGVTWVVQLYRLDAQANAAQYKGGSARVQPGSTPS